MSGRRPLSIRARLLVALLGATALLWLVATALSYADARHELDELFDAQMEESGRVLLLQAAHELDETIEHLAPRAADDAGEAGHPYAQQLHVQIWDEHGRLVYQSSSELPAEPVVRGIANGFADRTLHGARWRVLVLTDRESGLQLQLCQNYDARVSLAREIAQNMLVPLVVALPLLALVIWFGTAGGIRPLAALASELGSRTPENLSPIAGLARPRELEPVAASLNGLLARLRERFEVERRFTADAAHELRTPLAALKTQAQVALGASDAASREHALGQILRGTDRMTRLVQQLLTLARLDPDVAGAGEARLDLRVVARDTAAELAPLAVERDIAVAVGEGPPATITGSRELLATLARNLVENAIRHGGRGGAVQVDVTARDASVVLEVSDSGPGIPADERERVLDRFHRLASADQSGSGLGLSIVKRIADIHGASIVLGASESGGLRVTVTFPAGSGMERNC